ncbi:Peptide transporter MTD1 [Pseudozyma hubeiensis]|nr:Peptide transporter MTD1 [Pseudozyma hubeiensis]
MKACTSFFFTLAAAIFALVSVAAQDPPPTTPFEQFDGAYQSYCGPKAPAPDVGVACFQTTSNIREDAREESPGLTAYSSTNGQGFVVIIGLSGSTGFFTTTKVRVDMVAIDDTAWSNNTCVQYSITNVGAQTASKTGHYCYGQGAVYCSPQARPVQGGICFDTAFDFKTHFISSTPGILMMQSDDLRSVAVPVGPSGATMWLTTLEHRVDMVAIQSADWSPYTCVQYTISSTQGKGDTRVGHFCPGNPHVKL